MQISPRYCALYSRKGLVSPCRCPSVQMCHLNRRMWMCIPPPISDGRAPDSYIWTAAERPHHMAPGPALYNDLNTRRRAVVEQRSNNCFVVLLIFYLDAVFVPEEACLRMQHVVSVAAGVPSLLAWLVLYVPREVHLQVTLLSC